MKKKFSLVVWEKETGDFKNTSLWSITPKLAEETFELLYGKQFVAIHVFEGGQPLKTYRSLPYIN